MSVYTVTKHHGLVFLEEDGMPILDTEYRDEEQLRKLAKIAAVLTVSEVEKAVCQKEGV